MPAQPVSTVGVVLAALEHPEIQICYAEPEEYNTDGYASRVTKPPLWLLVNVFPCRAMARRLSRAPLTLKTMCNEDCS